MTALRQLSINEQSLQGSITRLSTGLRINSAADDPAGMIISENMRAQIKGIQQAIRNSQDAVNMTKTAEGALDEVSRLLLSMRSVAVSSANTAVVDTNQLQANQSQIRSVVESLDRIADQTSWGSKKLLNGASGTVTNITNSTHIASIYIGSEFGGETVRSGSLSMTRVQQATKSTTGALGHSYITTDNVNQGTFAINGISFTVGPGMKPSDVIAMVNEKSSLTNVQASYPASPGGIVLTATKFGDKFPIQYSESSDILAGVTPVTVTMGQNAIFDVTAPVQPSPNTKTETFTGGQGAGVDGLTLKSTSGNTLKITQQGNQQTVAPIGSITVGAIRFQIGANANQHASFSMPSVYARDLGTSVVGVENVSTIDVTSETGATNAIKIIDEAIKQLATLRGKLGSFQQNFLESNVRSLGVVEENLVASESTIRDADMAREITEYTRLQILSQSGMSVLAQANQAPRSVLSLLQGG